jgi:hypothetical protein
MVRIGTTFTSLHLAAWNNLENEAQETLENDTLIWMKE